MYINVVEYILLYGVLYLNGYIFNYNEEYDGKNINLQNIDELMNKWDYIKVNCFETDST